MGNGRVAKTIENKEINLGLLIIQSLIHIPPDRLCASHITHSTAVATTSRSTVKVLGGYSAATACVVAFQPFVTVASEYPHSTLNGTVTCSSHSSTA